MIAKQGVWISTWVGLVLAIGLFLIYHRLYQFYPKLPLTQYVQEIVGPVAGRIIAFLYVIYFLFIAVFVIRDFGELVTTFSYSATPLTVIVLLMLVAVMYTIGKGVEILARTGEIIFLFLTVIALVAYSLVLSSGTMNFHNLLPIFDEGVMPILEASYGAMVFPFGEILVFTMLFPYVDQPDKVKPTVIRAMIVSSVIISLTMVLDILVLGVDLYTRAQYPLLTMVQMIEGAGLLQRMDALYMIIAILCGFFRAAVLCYAALLGASTLFAVKDYRNLLVPISVVILFSSLAIASNYSELIFTVTKVFHYAAQIPMQIIIPSCLLFIAYYKHRKKESNREE